MMLDRALVLVASGVVAALAAGCSDPPAPPAQGAVSITVNPGAGRCDANGGLVTVPEDPAGMGGAVVNALTCKLTDSGCNPGGYVVTDGEQDTSVQCSVQQSGDQFQVQVSLRAGTRMTFRASGQVGASGGTMEIAESGVNTSTALLDPGCKVDILPNLGTVKPGAIWARYTCSAFTDPSTLGGEDCTSTGSFIFENCSK